MHFLRQVLSRAMPEGKPKTIKMLMIIVNMLTPTKLSLVDFIISICENIKWPITLWGCRKAAAVTYFVKEKVPYRC